MKAAATLERTTFRTSRLLEFCSRKELVAQTGHEPEAWPLVVLKELVDNALDACEEAGIAPEIGVQVEPGAITVVDNGPGMPPRRSRTFSTSRAASPAARRTWHRTAALRAMRSRPSWQCRSCSMARPAGSRSAPAVSATGSSSRSTRSGRSRWSAIVTSSAM